MTPPDPALTRALDDLTMQVSPDNVLAVHKVFKENAQALERELNRLTNETTVGWCGLDPVSPDAAAAFGRKVGQLLEVHRAHQRELAVAADHLKAIATSYGYTESEIQLSWESESR